MLVCALASRLGAKRTILRLNDTRLLEGYHYFYKQTLGFDVVLSTQDLVGDEIDGTVRENPRLEVQSFADGRVQVRRLRIREESQLLEAHQGPRAARGVLIGGVSAGTFNVPDGADTLLAGDQLYLIGTSENLDNFERIAGAKVLDGRRRVNGRGRHRAADRAQARGRLWGAPPRDRE